MEQAASRQWMKIVKNQSDCYVLYNQSVGRRLKIPRCVIGSERYWFMTSKVACWAVILSV